MLWTLLVVFLVMVLVLLVAGAVVVYVAYPHRGEEVPVAPWLGEALKRGVDAMPVLDEELQFRGTGRRDHRTRV
jgi:hypothetical protein